jgi:hypothetical protein
MRIAVIVSESAAIDSCESAIKLLFLTSTGELTDCCSPEPICVEAPTVKLMNETKDLCGKFDEERDAALQKEFDYERADHQFAQAELDWKRQFYTRFAVSTIVARILTARVQVMSKRITRQHKTRQVKNI